MENDTQDNNLQIQSSQFRYNSLSYAEALLNHNQIEVNYNIVEQLITSLIKSETEKPNSIISSYDSELYNNKFGMSRILKQQKNPQDLMPRNQSYLS